LVVSDKDRLTVIGASMLGADATVFGIFFRRCGRAGDHQHVADVVVLMCLRAGAAVRADKSARVRDIEYQDVGTAIDFYRAVIVFVVQIQRVAVEFRSG
jgi:hypothetical protein